MGPSARWPTSLKKVPQWHCATSSNWNHSRSMGVTALNMPFLGLVFFVAPIGRGYFHCHSQAATSFMGRPINLSPLFSACILLDDPCNLGCACIITSCLSLGHQALEDLCKYRLFAWSSLMLCLYTKNSVFNSSDVICWGSFTPQS
jgi:hypothetical protein